jgi:hypothetical protein
MNEWMASACNGKMLANLFDVMLHDFTQFFSS